MSSLNRLSVYRLFFLIILLAALSSCQPANDIRHKTTALFPQNKAPESGGTLVVGIPTEPELLNPLFALTQSSRNIIGLIFSRLADIDSNLNTYSPVLAKSWEIDHEKPQIIFHLRNNVYWHDGVPFTAMDVVFTYRMHINPVIAWDGFSFKQNISSVFAIDDSTVVFTFHQKNRTLLMDAVEGYIIPKHLLEKIKSEDLFTAEFNHQPIGTGPFRYHDWLSMQTITLVKNDAFFEPGKPYLDRIIFQIIPDNFSLINQLKAGEIDLVEGIYPKDYQYLKTNWDSRKSNVRPISYLGRRYDFIGWNLIDPKFISKSTISSNSDIESLKPHILFGDQKVRAALTMAIDRNAIMNTVNFGMAVPLNGPIPPILPTFNPEANVVWEYNPQKAVQLLNDLGWRDSDADNILDKDGRSFEFELLTESGNLRWEQVSTIVQAQLAKIGIRVTPRYMEPALLYGKILPAKDFDAVIIGWSVSLTTDYAPLFHSNSFSTPFHFTGYYSPEYDRLDDLSKTASTDETAQIYYDQIAHLLSFDLPYTWLYYRLECSAVHQRFKNIHYDKRGLYVNVKDWWIPAEERTEIDRMFQK